MKGHYSRWYRSYRIKKRSYPGNEKIERGSEQIMKAKIMTAMGSYSVRFLEKWVEGHIKKAGSIINLTEFPALAKPPELGLAYSKKH